MWLTQLLEKFYDWRRRRLAWLLVGVAVVTVMSALGVRRLRFEGDIAKLNGITGPTLRDEELIRSVWGDTLGMTLVITRGATVDEALAKNDRVADTLAKQPGISAVYSVAAICPSRATQEANERRWRTFWNEARREQLRATLQSVGLELGFRADAFAPFWRRLETEPAILTLDTFRDTPLEQAAFDQ